MQSGQIRSREFELEANASITDGFDVAAAYACQDIAYTKDLAGNVV